MKKYFKGAISIRKVSRYDIFSFYTALNTEINVLSLYRKQSSSFAVSE
jgi:hypothetical protein